MATIYVNARAIIERINNGKTEVVVQFATDHQAYEFPGGRVEFCESFYDAVKREVKEETGLDVIEVIGQDGQLITGDTPDVAVECFRPWAVYQYVKGSHDSMGIVFKCKVAGELLAEGDGTSDIKWVGLDELQNMIKIRRRFSKASKAVAVFYLNEQGIV